MVLVLTVLAAVTVVAAVLLLAAFPDPNTWQEAKFPHTAVSGSHSTQEGPAKPSWHSHVPGAVHVPKKHELQMGLHDAPSPV